MAGSLVPRTNLGGFLAQLGQTIGDRNRSQDIGTALQSGDYEGAAKAAFDAGDPNAGLSLLKLGQAYKQQKLGEENSRFVTEGMNGFGLGGPSPLSALGGTFDQAPRPDPSRAVPSFADTAAPSGSYLANLTRRESNGNPNARNPNSTATGLGQFTEGTWRDLARRKPELGLTPDGRTDPQQAMRATAAFTAENETILTRAGLPVNDATKYAVHFLGQQGGPRFIAASMQNPDASAASLAKPDQVAANRPVFFKRDGSPKTAREVFADFSKSFGGGRGGGGGGAPAPSVAYAGNEAETQALESRMGMNPGAVAQADMPAPNAQPAEFQIPPGPTATPQRAPVQQSAFGGGQPVALPSPSGAGSVGGPLPRTMTLPGAPGAQAPAGGDPSGGQVVNNVPAAAIAQSPLGQRIPFLLKAASLPGLPDGQRETVQLLLKQALDETKMTDTQKDYVFARANGFQGSPLDYQRELKRPGGPTKLSPGESIYDEDSNTIRATAPERNRSNVADDVEARKSAAAELGLQPGTPEYRSYTLTGKMPREDQPLPTALDRKAVADADDRALGAQSAIDALTEAKRLSPKAYAGPQAGNRGYVSSLFGSEAGTTTTDLDNLVTTQALGQLKSIFGAAPTEGERKILLDIQGSVSQPDKVRQRIYDRGIALAKRRLQENQEKAAELRGGTYYKPGGGPSGGPRTPAALPDLEAEARRRGLL